MVLTRLLQRRSNQRIGPYVGYSPNEGVKFTVVPTKPKLEYKMVDLGLPSGLKWADRNVGAETPQDKGLYFSWGNVDGHTVDESGNVADGYSFDENTYSTTLGGQYTGSTLDSEHDAATSIMGDTWRMPTIEEYRELVNAVKSSDGTKGTLTCQYEYIDLNGEQQSLVVYNDAKNGYFSIEGLMVNGRPVFKTILGIRFTNDVTGASVYFPTCSSVKGSILATAGSSGNYWSSSINDTSNSRYFYFFGPYDVYACNSKYRYCGLCVRAVK